jgi:hypothetical protein
VYDPTGGRLAGRPGAAGGASSGGGGGSASASGSGSGSGGGGAAAVQPVHVRITDVSAFLSQPGPREGPVQCFISREKDGGVGPKSHRRGTEGGGGAGPGARGEWPPSLSP